MKVIEGKKLQVVKRSEIQDWRKILGVRAESGVIGNHHHQFPCPLFCCVINATTAKKSLTVSYRVKFNCVVTNSWYLDVFELKYSN